MNSRQLLTKEQEEELKITKNFAVERMVREEMELDNKRVEEARLKNSTNPKDLEGNKKPPMSLVPQSALIYLAEAFREGAKKYGAYNWRSKKVQAMIYLDAILRHAAAVIDGEDIDPESGKHHLAGLMASAAVYIDALETGNLIDNRPTKGNAGQMIRRIGGKE